MKKTKVKKPKPVSSLTKAKTTPTAAPLEKKEAEPASATAAVKRRTPSERGAQEKRPSGLDAAAKVLAEAGQPMSCNELVKAMLEKSYWQTNGKTPAATIYAALIRHIAAAVQKCRKSRFRKVERGKFTLNQ